MVVPRYFLGIVFLFLFLNIYLNFSFNIKNLTQPLPSEFASWEKVCLSRENNEIIFHGARDKKRIALTFDADMTPFMKEELESGAVKSWINTSVLDILNKTHTKATLFLTGMWAEIYPEVVKSLSHNSLFEIANHSYSHPSFHGECYGLSRISNIEKENQINHAQEIIKHITGVTPRYFRFPGGCYGLDDLTLLTSHGLVPVQWDTIGNDGFNLHAENIYNNIVSHVHNGSIVVLHMHGGPNAPYTAEALLPAIQTLKAKGYEFVTMNELLSNNANSSSRDISRKF